MNTEEDTAAGITKGVTNTSGVLAQLAADYDKNNDDDSSVDSESDSSSSSESGSSESSSSSSSSSDSEESNDIVAEPGKTETLVVTLKTSDGSIATESCSIAQQSNGIAEESSGVAAQSNGIAEESNGHVAAQINVKAEESNDLVVTLCNGISEESNGVAPKVPGNESSGTTTKLGASGVEEMDSEKTETAVNEVDTQGYRSRRSSSSSSSSYCSEISVELSSSNSDSEDDNEGEKEKTGTGGPCPRRKKKPLSFTDCLGLGELEPIVDLQISVPENKVELIGTIANIIGCIVTVESMENKPALDLNTVLFLDEGRKALGHVFEVFGRTRQPHYCVRFNSDEHVKERGIGVGMKVYAAPGTEHTRYVFLAQLERLRGTDASWKDDAEVPDEFADYSDDEMEVIATHKGRRPRPKRSQPINRSLPPQQQQQDAPNVNRFARKRNSNFQAGAPLMINGFGGVQHPGQSFVNFQACPPGRPGRFNGAPGFNGGLMNHHFQPMGDRAFNGGQPFYGNGYPEWNGPPGYRTPVNPFSVGGSAVNYRPHFGNNGYSHQNFLAHNISQGFPHLQQQRPPRGQQQQQQQQYPNFWCSAPPQFNQQQTWPGYQYQFNLPNFGAPPAATPPISSPATGNFPATVTATNGTPSGYPSMPGMVAPPSSVYSSQSQVPSSSSYSFSPSVRPATVSAAPVVYSAGKVVESKPVTVSAAPVVYSAPPTMYPKTVSSSGSVSAVPSKS